MVADHCKVNPNHIAQAPNPELLAKHDFVLVRHAVTDFNMEFAHVVGTYGIDSPEYR
jgi:hypothetical protein